LHDIKSVIITYVTRFSVMYVELFWYAFTIRNYKNMAKKSFGKCSSEQQNGVSNERSNWRHNGFTSNCATSSDKSYIYSYSFNM